jgi:hypothetical protein
MTESDDSCLGQIETPKPTDEYLCALAREFVECEYAEEGERIYFWEEWDNPEDDLNARTVSSYLPPSGASDDDYSWSEVAYCEIKNAKVLERNDEALEYIVQVDALIAVAHDSDEEGEELEPMLRQIKCYVEYDGEEFFIEDADE